jgi:hypothetical protein
MGLQRNRANLFCTTLLDVVNKSWGAIAERKFDFDPFNLTDNAGVGSMFDYFDLSSA